MELLGPSIKEKQQTDAAVMVKTVVQFVDQAVRGFQYKLASH